MDLGVREVILGMFDSREKAEEHKRMRDADKDRLYCDVGKSWINEEVVR